MVSTSAPAANELGMIKGNIHGGRQPIAGSHVYLFAASDGIGTSTSLLKSVTTGDFPTASDGSAYYVTTDAEGNFSLSGAYSCTEGTQVYALAKGGDAGAGVDNPAIELMAVLGQCPESGSLADNVPYVEINEVSTVAMAFATAGFSAAPTEIYDSGTAASKLGMANAFATVTNLIDVGSGTALLTTPGGTGTAPQMLLNSIANSLAACVNSTAADFTECNELFLATQQGGSKDLSVPVDTATAAINLAHNPGVNVATIYGLAAGIGTPFEPALPAAPNDFTMGIQYAGSGITNTGSLALDASGNVWMGAVTGVPGNTLFTLAEMSPLGVLATGSPFVSETVNGGGFVAIDPAGDVWYLTQFALGETTSAGAAISPATGWSVPDAEALDGFAIGGNGLVWISDYGTGKLIVADAFGTSEAPATIDLPGVLAPSGIAFDNAGNAWVGGEGGGAQLNGFDQFGGALAGSPYTGNGLSEGVAGVAVTASSDVFTVLGSSLSEFNTSGGAVASGISGGGLSDGYAIAVDGSSNLWVTPVNNASPAGIAEFDFTGKAVSPSTGLNALESSGSIAVDGSGNVWAGQAGPVLELVGAASPVVTPMSLAVAQGKVGMQP